MNLAASDQPTLGTLIRRLRLNNSWTLRQLSDTVNIPRSTLAKVEHDRLTLTYDKLRQMAERLQISMSELLGQAEGSGAEPEVVMARRSLSSRANSAPIATAHADYELLCTDLRDKRMVPIIARIRARDVAEFGTPLKHPGEEFIFVLEGAIEVHTSFYEPSPLTLGQGMYLDGAMAHAYVAKDCVTATILAVCCGVPPWLALGPT